MGTKLHSRVLRLPEVLRRLGIGRDSVYRGGREGWLPKRVKVGKRASGWFEHEIEAYLQRNADQRGDQLVDQRSDQPADQPADQRADQAVDQGGKRGTQRKQKRKVKS